MDRFTRNLIHKKQDQIPIKQGAVNLSDFKEGNPEFRFENGQLMQYVKYNNTLYKSSFSKAASSSGSLGSIDFTSHYADAAPDTADTWSALISGGSTYSHPIDFEMGTGTTPATSVSYSADSQRYVDSYFYTPFDINLISCDVLFAADELASSVGSNNAQFSVMKYTMSTDGAASGNLSSGVECFKSNAAVALTGEENIQYDGLKLVKPSVKRGEILVAFARMSATTCDLQVNMRITYKTI